MSLHTDSGRKDRRGGSLWIWTTKLAHGGGLVWLPAIRRDGQPNHDAPNSYRIAEEMAPILREALATFGVPWRGIWCADFQVLRDTEGSGVLFECFFGTNPDDPGGSQAA